MNQPRFYILFLLLVALSAAGPAVVWAADGSSAPNLAPELQIKIGDFGQASDFQAGYGVGSCPPEKSQYGKCLEVPWISQYIGALYRYGVALAAALAMLMITIGGAIWLTAGGSSERVSTAKSFIISAISGLMLALFSYVILYTVNPRLVALEPLSVPVVSDVPEPKLSEKTTSQYTQAKYHCLFNGECLQSSEKQECESMGGQFVDDSNYEAMCGIRESCACYQYEVNEGTPLGRLYTCGEHPKGVDWFLCKEKPFSKVRCFKQPVLCSDVPDTRNNIYWGDP
ncbi:MAG: hypothetical protein A2951_03205 [Candidatus Buchananbacteria bacterium RIFCSPLOWO2_01_FULL_56_15]|uniref:Uncharacterized protein n=2 Tax=Candidatus Buchananiibacteriota TaxID=1817903 RepID=A0A1G1YFJ1_9BACT|nr:MAG: hypothetical protein A3J59_03035 [Candidatus Buchananbacteria bacterium RIFCSPHIGHO2_02_FULL_56_16]OGY55335.1 MAG: hypothetical protein A2951_03205 [Candidatus Buchananbacteria bacterium RIFCSPLOWO2_01_FULL_56_15]